MDFTGSISPGSTLVAAVTVLSCCVFASLYPDVHYYFYKGEQGGEK